MLDFQNTVMGMKKFSFNLNSSYTNNFQSSSFINPFDSIINGKKSLKDSSEEIKMYIKQLQNYILWHYQVGSKYDTPFWNYAKGLTFKDDLLTPIPTTFLLSK